MVSGRDPLTTHWRQLERRLIGMGKTLGLVNYASEQFKYLKASLKSFPFVYKFKLDLVDS